MGVDVCITEATLSDADALWPLLREQDADEARALGMEPLEALRGSVNASEVAVAVRFNGELAAIFGVAPLREHTVLGRSSTATVWMVSSHACSRHPKAFLRTSRRVVDALLTRYERLVNVIDARYTGALRWAEWLGFHLGPAIPMGPHGLLFHPFTVERN